MPGTVSNTNQVPVWVVANNINLGFCNSGDVTVKVTPNWADMTTHQTGEYLVDASFAGAKVEVMCNFAETESLDVWARAFCFGEKQEDATSPPYERFAFNSIDATAAQWDIGTRATSKDFELTLIPQASYSAPGTQGDDDLVVPYAFCRNVGDVLFSVENNQGLECTFEGLLGPTVTTGINLLYRGRFTGTWSKA